MSYRLTPAPSIEQWNDWQWQLRSAVRTTEELSTHLRLSDAELVGVRAAERAGLPLGITPYMLELCDDDPDCPIRRQLVPTASEAEVSPGDMVDPLGEENHSPVPHLVHRYPDRVLLLVTDRCAVYCRFCTRSRLVGHGGGALPMSDLSAAFEYVEADRGIREVIISGGDVLGMATARIVRLLERVRQIDHVETIRLATRAPVVLPQRIDGELIRALRPYHPLWLMTHFNHPKELTQASRAACRRLVDGGFPVMNQSVLLRGVNDRAEVLTELFRGLIRERVRPYYLLQADPVRGTGHLRTPLSTGIEIMRQLQGKLSGIAIPKFIVDTPGGHGKVPVSPDYVVAKNAGSTRFRSPSGREVDYFDPPVAFCTSEDPH